MNRVHILGGSGSGKTELAKQFASHRKLPHVELDAIYYRDAPLRQRRTAAERGLMLADAAAEEAWVMEGIFWQTWVQPAFERADRIIVLQIPASTRHWRVLRRHLTLLRSAPPRLWPTFFPTLFELIRSNRAYDASALSDTFAALSPHLDKVAACRSNAEARQLLGLGEATRR